MKKYLIPYDLNEYCDFFDKIWSENFYKLIDGTILYNVGDHFSGNLYSAIRAFTLPWLFVTSVSEAYKINRDELWIQYRQRSEFGAALGKTSENCYVAIYCSYEDYILQSIKIVSHEDKLRITDRKFNKKMISFIGEETASKCWNNNTIALAREIRHCMVHNGGRSTETLLKKQKSPNIYEDNILITPIEVRALYLLIKECVLIFTNKLIKEKG
ncbi:MAG: hypothetical protein WCQ87_01955 [Parabacteroides sp.]